MPDGEEAKTLATVEDLCRELRPVGPQPRPTPSSPSAAASSPTSPGSPPPSTTGACPWCTCSTTLLGQIDAAIGGKTGVNLPEGKNLVGAFWQPSAVLCDTEVLATLPPREYRSGLGELAKYHFLGGGDLDRLPLDERGRRVRRASRPRSSPATSARAAAGPSSTTATPSPTPSRSPAHYDLRHGEAVAVGLVFAAELARRLGRIDADARGRAPPGGRRPTTCRRRCPPGSTTDELVELMGRDKKALDGLTFVLDGPDGVEPVDRRRPRRHRRAIDAVR